MRDIIWTIIIVWVVWKLIDAFRTISSSRNAQGSSVNNANYNQNYNSNSNTTSNASAKPKKGELKSDAGEYVDYEEVK